MTATRCGFAALAGRPNVGKSTLLNHLLGRKLSITARKPQTTRHSLLGIDTRAETQIIFLDTPGIHRRDRRAMNRYMAGQATSAIRDSNVVVLLTEARRWTSGDELALRRVADARCACICAINKIDRLRDRSALLPMIDDARGRHDFEAIVPISALKSEGLDALWAEVSSLLPQGKHLFAEGDVTDRPTEFFLAEIVREKIVRRLGAEIPHRATVAIERFTAKPHVAEVDAVIYVERASQKGIVIGRGGSRLKSIGQDARADIETLLGQQVMLRLWVKVRRGWTDDARALATLGYR